MYWLNHYGFWGGWQSNASPEVREIYIQKKLNTRPQWLGIVIHEAVAWALEQGLVGGTVSRERTLERTVRRARRQIEESEQGRYRQNPKKFPGFSDHYYGQPVATDEWKGVLSELERQVSDVFENPVFMRLLAVPQQVREVEQLRQILVGDVPVWVSLDVLVENRKGGYVIIDWKTGRHHSSQAVAAQLGVYAVYVLDAYFGIRGAQVVDGPLDRIVGMHANLRESKHETHAIGSEHVAAAIDLIANSASKMRSMLQNVQDNVANKEDFPMEPEGAEVCSTCSFRRTCKRE